jgi:hypothetical protein
MMEEDVRIILKQILEVGHGGVDCFVFVKVRTGVGLLSIWK